MGTYSRPSSQGRPFHLLDYFENVPSQTK